MDSLIAALDLASAPAGGPVAFHRDLSPASLLSAYRNGLFPFPTDRPEGAMVNEITFESEVSAGRIPATGADPYAVGWWSPDPRPIIRTDRPQIQRSLRRQLRNKVEWTTTLDTRFEQVVENCRAHRQSRWLTDPLIDSLVALREAGHAHSVEVWEDDGLVGGTFGVRVGAVFSADSQFTLRSGAGKVAVIDLLRRFADRGGVAVDVQHDSAHARLLGAAPTPRADYLDLLRRHRDDDVPLTPGRLPARRLAEQRRSR
ncbi:leucyl/phenylalanyl-tRNA--protein transferase [Actinokineospora sp. 24-640]